MRRITDGFVLRVNEAPGLITSDTLAGQVHKGAILIVQASRPCFLEQLVDGVPRNIGHARDRAYAHALDQHRENLRTFRERQLIHVEYYA